MNTSKLSLLWCLILLLNIGFIGCDRTDDDDDIGGTDEPEVMLQIKGKTGTEDFVLNNAYTNFYEHPYKITKLQFYLSNIRLINSSNEEVMVSEVELYNMDAPYNITANVPIGDYVGVKFGLGLDESLNASDPSTFNKDHPLGINGNYWSWAAKYIFVKLEGDVDSTANNSNPSFQADFLYHVGADDLYREVTVNQSFSITQEGTNIVSLPFDVDQLLNNSNTPIDPFKNPVTHTSNYPDVAKSVIDNFAQSWQ